MIAALNILTPIGQQQVQIASGDRSDEIAMRAWRASGRHSRPDLAEDSLEYVKLAGKRWRYYLKRDESATSLDDLVSKIEARPKGEIGFMLVARPTWRNGPRSIGIAWCRRTWCNHIVLDFLAAHPQSNDPASGYKGIGFSLMLALAKVAHHIQCPLVWGESTESSSTFYQKLLGGRPVSDCFSLDEATLQAQANELARRDQIATRSQS